MAGGNPGMIRDRRLAKHEREAARALRRDRKAEKRAERQARKGKRRG